MAWKAVRGQDLWKHDGTTAITGYATGVVQYVPGATPTTNGTMAGTSNANQWVGPIDVNGADLMYIVYEGKVVEIGTISAVVPTALTCSAVGVPFLTDTSYTPRSVFRAPNLVTDAAGGNTESQRGQHLWTLSPDHGQPARLASVNVVCGRMGLLAGDTVANGNAINWRFLLGERSETIAAATASNSHPIRTIGLSKIWLALEQNSTITGATTTTRIRGAIYPVLVYTNLQGVLVQ